MIVLPFCVSRSSKIEFGGKVCKRWNFLVIPLGADSQEIEDDHIKFSAQNSQPIVPSLRMKTGQCAAKAVWTSEGCT